jgi:hypothetical protein
MTTTSPISATTSQSLDDTPTASATTSTTATKKSTRTTLCPLTMIDFGSDIKTYSATERKGRKRKLVIAQSDDGDIEDEENDYEILDDKYCVCCLD